MKTPILITLMYCCSFSFYAQSQMTPKNPIAFKYLNRHHDLKGNILSVTEISGDRKTHKEFDKTGHLIKDIPNITISTNGIEYTYDSVLRTITTKEANLLYFYQTNVSKDVTHRYKQYKDKLSNIYTYKGSLIQRDSSAEGYGYKDYSYNEKGQVIKEQRYNKANMLESVYEFAYSLGNNQLTVTTVLYNKAMQKTSEWQSVYYYEKGNLVKEVYTDTQAVSTIDYTVDTKGNWTIRTSEKKYKTPESQQYNAKGTTTRTLTYY